MSKTRLAAVGSALLVLVGLGLAVRYAFVATVGRRDGPEALRYMPRGASLVAYVNVRAVVSSGLRQQARRMLKSESGGWDFERELGINLETDVDELVACVDPSIGPSETLVVATGRFDEAKTDSFARSRGVRSEQYKGKRLFLAPGADPFAMAFLHSRTTAIGHTALVRRAIELESGRGPNVTADADLMKRVGSVRTGAAWAVGKFDAFRSTPALSERVNQLPTITWFSIVVRVGDRVDGTLRAETRDEESADRLRDLARSVLAFARLQAGSNADVQKTIQSVELSRTGTTVALSFSVPTHVLDLLGAPTTGAKDPP